MLIVLIWVLNAIALYVLISDSFNRYLLKCTGVLNLNFWALNATCTSPCNAWQTASPEPAFNFDGG